MRKSATLPFILLSAVLLASCAITRDVRAVDARDISLVCIKKNPAVMMDGFLLELEAQVQRKGFKTRIYEGSLPVECRHHMDYTANWRWDMAMYLVFAELDVYEGDLQIGQARYDARAGGANMSKFGPTVGKLSELVDELFAKTRVQR